MDMDVYERRSGRRTSVPPTRLLSLRPGQRLLKKRAIHLAIMRTMGKDRYSYTRRSARPVAVAQLLYTLAASLHILLFGHVFSFLFAHAAERSVRAHALSRVLTRWR